MAESYQPNPRVARLARLRECGPVSRELRTMLDAWLQARTFDRELQTQAAEAAQAANRARIALQEAVADADEAQLDGRPVDPQIAKDAAQRVVDTERAALAARSRLDGFRDRLRVRETTVAHYAERNADQIAAELVAPLAEAEQQLRQAMQRTAALLDDVGDRLWAIDAVCTVPQGGQGVTHVQAFAELAVALGRAAGEPVAQLPAPLDAVAGDAGMVGPDEDEAPARIPANLPAPGGPRDLAADQRAQAARMDAALARGFVA